MLTFLIMGAKKLFFLIHLKNLEILTEALIKIVDIFARTCSPIMPGI